MKQYDQVMLRKGVRDPSLFSPEILKKHPEMPTDYRIDSPFIEGEILRLRFNPSNNRLNFEGHRIDAWYDAKDFQPVEEWLNENQVP